VNLVVCADVGSTYTKVAVVDADTGELRGSAAHRTTVDTDVLDGLDAAVAAAGGDGYERLVCSSAGGGLRLAVVGYESLVTAKAGTRVGLSAGARVVHVAAGPLDGTGVAALREARPDVVLLVGGTDGGDAEVLLHNGQRLARARLRVPVVLAGNAAVRDQVARVLAERRVPVVACDNVLPRIGVLRPEPARAAIREVFTRHVIGGKRLSRGTRFARMVLAATPDAVLAGVELLADGLAGDLAVLDVGGATTDVYSVRVPDAHRQAAAREVAGTQWRGRTVEGDLGVRWSATGVVRAAAAQRLLAPGEEEVLAPAATRRAGEPGLVAAGAAEREHDLRLAALAGTLGLRRHVRDGADLSEVRVLIGSGGVLRHASADRAAGVLRAALGDHEGGWALPRRAAVAVDADHVLAPAGLLAARYPRAARALLRSRLPDVHAPSAR
jgi:uncharacterized protein (TIGR01319 family)